MNNVKNDIYANSDECWKIQANCQNRIVQPLLTGKETVTVTNFLVSSTQFQSLFILKFTAIS